MNGKIIQVLKKEQEIQKEEDDVECALLYDDEFVLCDA